MQLLLAVLTDPMLLTKENHTSVIVYKQPSKVVLVGCGNHASTSTYGQPCWTTKHSYNVTSALLPIIFFDTGCFVYHLNVLRVESFKMQTLLGAT